MPRYYTRKINKWVTLAACVPVALSAGLSYAFSVWSPALKEAYSLTQTEEEFIGACLNLGGYSSIISGLVYDAMDRRHHIGSRFSLLAGCTTNFAGFLGLWAAVTHRFNATVPQLAALAALAANGGTWFDTTALATNLRNFPGERGVVVGLIKASVGLSSSMYTNFYMGFFQPRADRFLLFLAITPAAVGLLALPLVNHVSFTQQSEVKRTHAGGPSHSSFSTDRRFWFALQTLASLALYLMAVALVNARRHLAAAARAVLASVPLFLLTPLVLVVWRSGGLFAQRPEEEDAGERERRGVPTCVDEEAAAEGGGLGGEVAEASSAGELQAPLLADVRSGSRDAAAASSSSGGGQDVTEAVPSLTLAQALSTLDFWLMAGISGVGIGAALALLNNLAEVVASLGGPKEARSVLVSLFSVFSCGGRLLFGALPDKALLLYGTPRPAFLAGAGATTTFAFLCLALSSTGMTALYLVVPAIGLAFGAHWSLLPSLASELFGLRSFASIYTTLQVAPALGGYALGVQLVARVYEAVRRRHDDPGACIGHDCFQVAFLTMTALAAAAAALSTLLLARTRALYAKQAAAVRILHEASLAEDS